MPSSAARPGCDARCGRVPPWPPNSIWRPTTTSVCRSTRTSSRAEWTRCAPGAPAPPGRGWSPATPSCTRSSSPALAEFVGAAAGLVFSSGYTANQGAVVGLSGPGSLLVSDAYSHASLVDACRLSRARVVVTPHRDLDAVDAALAVAGRGAGRRHHRVGVLHRRRAGPAARTARGVPPAPGTAHRRRGARPGCARRRARVAARAGTGRRARCRDDDDAVEGARQPGWRGARVGRRARSPHRLRPDVHLRHRTGAGGGRRRAGRAAGAGRASRGGPTRVLRHAATLARDLRCAPTCRSRRWCR